MMSIGTMNSANGLCLQTMSTPVEHTLEVWSRADQKEGIRAKRNILTTKTLISTPSRSRLRLQIMSVYTRNRKGHNPTGDVKEKHFKLLSLTRYNDPQ